MIFFVDFLIPLHLVLKSIECHLGNLSMRYNIKDPARQRMIECHYCEDIAEKLDNNTMAKCCIKRCNKYYCTACIQKHFNPEFEMQMYKKDTWICYFCQGNCLCDKCKNEGSTFERKISRKKNNRSAGKIPEEIQESGSNFSQSFKPETLLSQNQEFEVREVQIAHSHEEKDIEEEVPEFKLYEEDEMILFPPFYRRWVQRKNMFYNFVIKQSKKPNLLKRNLRKDEETQPKRGSRDIQFQ